ncbi:hypothetical protein TYRP_006345 [Tyrophagus putrescentiae]|nr:hypothetical protein TYRP_006345 [Tyrophagus putrescentiae]
MQLAISNSASEVAFSSGDQCCPLLHREGCSGSALFLRTANFGSLPDRFGGQADLGVAEESKGKERTTKTNSSSELCQLQSLSGSQTERFIIDRRSPPLPPPKPNLLRRPHLRSIPSVISIAPAIHYQSALSPTKNRSDHRRHYPNQISVVVLSLDRFRVTVLSPSPPAIHCKLLSPINLYYHPQQSGKSVMCSGGMFVTSVH